ncbi:MAG TPA: lytic transglycosylase domain-containing protein [Candidatus Limnocylindrales bacterium]|nr:lytic transglycosylase domain-containing protein [Candidatus Limnocylindrales bacterium]
MKRQGKFTAKAAAAEAMLATAMLTALMLAAPAARADYIVLRSGVRLHVTSYQRDGATMRCVVAGGTVEVAASDVESIEPEESFAANAPAVAMPADAGPFAKLIRDAAQKHGVDEGLIRSVIAVESNFKPRAISRRQALGLMQLLPQTAARYSVGNVFDPAQNIDGGTRYLKDLLAQYQGNLRLALAAYNAGPDSVERYGGVPPFRETQSYVKRITASVAKSKKSAAPSAPSMAQLKAQLNATGASAASVSTGAGTGAATAAAGAASGSGLD